MNRRNALIILPALGLPGAIRAAEMKPPRPLPTNIDDARASRLLGHSLEALCADYAALNAVVEREGLTAEVVAVEAGLSGMEREKLAGMAAFACGKPRDNLVAVDAANRSRKLEWLISLRLRALEQVAFVAVRPPVERPSGPVGDFLGIHDLLVSEMRAKAAPLTYGEPTASDAAAMGKFWNTVILEHHWAEDRTLYPLVRQAGGKAWEDRTNLLLAEHYHLAQLDHDFRLALDAVAAGRPVKSLVPLVDQVRGEVEMHFAKEAEAVIKPLAGKAGEREIEAVVAEQERALGPFLRTVGWRRKKNSR